MIVVDASVTVEMVLATVTGQRVAWRLRSSRARAQAPHLLGVEATHALRRLTVLREISSVAATEAIQKLRSLEIRRWPHEPFLGRAWQLRENLTPYDAVYVALAETLDAPLLTTDARLAGSSGHRAAIELVT